MFAETAGYHRRMATSPSGSVLVVGASRGIGSAIAAGFSAAGHEVLAWARSSPDDRDGPPVRFDHVDVRSPDEVAAALGREAASGFVPDVVVYVAGIAKWGLVAEQADDEWRGVLDVNAVGAHTVLRAFWSAFGRHPHRVIAICSDAAGFPAAGRSAYHASKAAMSMLFESYRREVRDSGVLVTIVYLGKVNTTLSSRTDEQNARALQPEQVARTVVDLARVDATIEVRSIELSSVRSPFGP